MSPRRVLLRLVFFLLVTSSSISSASSHRGSNPRALLRQQGLPLLESYWESYLSWPNQQNMAVRCDQNIPDWTDHSAYGYDLAALPISTGPGTTGLNVVNIAHASAYGHDFDCYYTHIVCEPLVCGLNLYPENTDDVYRVADLWADIQLLQASGAVVKMSFGGEMHGNIGLQQPVPVYAERIVSRVVQAVEDLGLDGIDLDQNQGCGTANFNCDDQSSVHLYVISELRRRLPNKIISYTFPASVDFPFRDVVQFGHDMLDTITLYRATQATVDAVVGLGVPKEKIVWGLAIGCNDNNYANVTLEDAQDVALMVKTGGYAGVMTWSVNRDTDHRLEGSAGCAPEQTGMPDGTFIHAISEILMS